MLIAMERHHHLKKDNRGASLCPALPVKRKLRRIKASLSLLKVQDGTRAPARIYKRDNAFD